MAAAAASFKTLKLSTSEGDILWKSPALTGIPSTMYKGDEAPRLPRPLTLIDPRSLPTFPGRGNYCNTRRYTLQSIG